MISLVVAFAEKIKGLARAVATFFPFGLCPPQSVAQQTGLCWETKAGHNAEID